MAGATISAIPGHPAGVELIRGEAAFKLSRTPSPLVVLAGPLATVADDPGTSFVVRVYPGDTLADLLVDQGFVTSAHRGAHRAASPAADSLVVSGGSRARAAQGGFLAIAPDVAPDSFTLVPLGTLRGSCAVPLRKVLSRIKRRYGVAVDLASPDLGERYITATAVVRKMALMYGLETTQPGSDRYLVRTP